MQPITNNSVMEKHLEDLKLKVEEIINTKIPQNLEIVNSLLESAEFQLPPIKFVGTKQSEKCNCIESAFSGIELNGTDHSLSNVKREDGKPEVNCVSYKYPSNKTVLKLIEKIDPLIAEFYFFGKIINAWLELLKPKLATGNSFGAEVIDEVSGLISKCATSGYGHFDYFETRNKCCSKLQKYPENEDAFNGITKLDWSRVFLIIETLHDLRNGYATVLNLLFKNWTTITSAEKTSSSDNMY